MRRACVLIVLGGGLLLAARADAQSFHAPRVYGRYPASPEIGERYYIPAPTVYPSDYPFYGYGAYGYYGPYGYGLIGRPGSFTWFGTPGIGYPTGYIFEAPSYQVAPFVPPLYQDVPPAESPYENEVLSDELLENELRWNRPLHLGDDEPRPRRRIAESSPGDKIRSARAQAAGDRYLRKQNFGAASIRYKDAVNAAGDRPEARVRYGIALTAIGRYELAAEQFKIALALDPTWPQTGESLLSIFGERNELAKDSVLHKVVAWVREDIRDPDRLFLLGVLVYFDGNAEQAQILFETALRLAGGGEHLKAFLRSADLDAAPEREAPPNRDPAGREPDVPPLPAPPDEPNARGVEPRRPSEVPPRPIPPTQKPRTPEPSAPSNDGALQPEGAAPPSAPESDVPNTDAQESDPDVVPPAPKERPVSGPKLPEPVAAR